MSAIVPYIPPTPLVPSPQELGFGQTTQRSGQAGVFQQFQSAQKSTLERSPAQGDQFNYHQSHSDVGGVEADSSKFGVGKALKYMLYGLSGFFIGKFINNRLGLFNKFTFKNFLKFSALGLGGFHMGKWLLNKVNPPKTA